MKVYVVIDNNHEIYGDREYEEWIDGIYSTKEKALVGVHKCELALFNLLQEEYQSDYSLETIQKWQKNRLIDSPVEIKVFELDCSDGKIK